jgi:hypothetical protein
MRRQEEGFQGLISKGGGVYQAYLAHFGGGTGFSGIFTCHAPIIAINQRGCPCRHILFLGDCAARFPKIARSF